MKKPKFTRGFVDRHGHARFYFRRAGYKPVAFAGPAMVAGLHGGL
jgi:hypothetical protein